MKALNENSSEVSSSDDDSDGAVVLTREAQEENLHKLYLDALEHLKNGDETKAKEDFHSLLEEINSLPSSDTIVSSEQLRYLTLKNLGTICTDDIEFFKEALQIDGSDINLWIKTGQRAFDTLKDYVLARNCLEEAYELNPKNWIVIDKLIDTYMVLHDLKSALDMSIAALEMQPSFPKGQVVLHETTRLNPSLKTFIPESLKKHTTLSNHFVQFHDSFMTGIRLLKEKRRQRFDEDRERNKPKRPKLSLSLEINDHALKTLANRILKLKELIQKDAIPHSTPIDISYEQVLSSREDTPNASTDESNASQELPKEDIEKKDKKKAFQRSSSSNTNSNGFPIEFLEKRRSGRVQRLNKSDGSDSSVRENLLAMIPPSIRHRIIIEEEEESEVPQVIETQEMPSQEAEKLIVKSFLSKLEALKDQRVVIWDVIRSFCHEVAKNAHLINVPNAYTPLYDFYRSCNPLPGILGSRLDDFWTTEEMMAILVANELNFKLTEAYFLEKMLICLETALTEEKYYQFEVRLLFAEATKGGEQALLDDVLLTLTERHLKVDASNKTVISISSVKSLQGAKCEHSLTQLMELGKYQEVINALKSKTETEISAAEKEMLFDAICKSSSWEVAVTLITKREKLDEKKIEILLKSVETGAQMNMKLMEKLIVYSTEKSSSRAWSCLYWVFYSESNPEIKESDRQMIELLSIGHHYLGKRGICTSNDGEFLLLALDYFLNKSNDSHGSLDDEALQCFNCLFGFPARRSSCHANSGKIEMNWTHVPLVFHYFTSEELPEFDDSKTASIDAETEQLLSQILSLVPENMKPDKLSMVIAKYLTGDDAVFPTYDKPETDSVTRSLYYLLADYNFKNKEFKKAKYFYALDLVLNPDRFDSWAGYGLTRHHQLELLMSKGDNLSKQEKAKFFKMAEACYRCYKKALEIDPSNTKLWIECGNILYNVASHITRMKKTTAWIINRNRELEGTVDVNELRTKQKEFLARARDCFQSASQSEPEDGESWLPFYLLGKIHEKHNVIKALSFYELADLHLFNNGANYPKRISYHSPPVLAIEALEVYFRIHACVLKYLTMTTEPSRRVLLRIKSYLTKASRSPFVKQNSSSPVNVENDLGSTASSSNTFFNKDVEPVRELLHDMLEMVNDRHHRQPDVPTLRKSLIGMCLKAINRCLLRFPEHYKSLYRLAYYYYASGDVLASKDVLLKNLPTTAEDSRASFNEPSAPKPPVMLAGLFAERKNNNLFNGIWRIPIDEVDRPGSFSTHMYRSAFLLIRVATTLFDYNTLCQVTIQLSKIPEAGKKYLRDGDRLLLAQEAFDSCTAILKNHLVVTRDFLPEINKVCEKLIKANVFTSQAHEMMRECLTFVRTNR